MLDHVSMILGVVSFVTTFYDLHVNCWTTKHDGGQGQDVMFRHHFFSFFVIYWL